MADWQPGDLALCVKVTHPAFLYPATKLAIGRVYTVALVGRPVARVGGECGLLMHEACPDKPNHGFPETLFVKVTPGHKIEGIEAEKRLPGKVGQDA